MQHQVTTQQQVNIPVSLLEMPPEAKSDYTKLDKMLCRERNFSLDVLALKYLSATIDLNEIMEEQQVLLKNQPALQMLSQKLLDIFKEAAGGSFQALIDVTNAGETTLLGVLDMLEDIGIAAEAAGEQNIYAELEAQLAELHHQYFELQIRTYDT